MSEETVESPFMHFRQGVIACIPTLLGYWPVGFACGAIGVASGFSIYQIGSLAIFLYTGAAQFLFYSMATTGSSILQIAIAVAFINLRYLLINTYMAQFFRHANLFEKLVGSLIMTDETFGVASQYARRHNDRLPFAWLLGLNLTAWLNWIMSSIAGALLASALPNWLKDSLSFSLVGMFVGLLVLAFQDSRTRILDLIVIIIAIGIVILSQGHISNNITVIGATLIAATIGMTLLMTTARGKR